MKKNQWIVLFLSILVILSLLSGCTQGGIYKEYLQAQENTEKIQQSNSLTTFEVALDLEQAGLSESAKRELEIFSNVKGTFLVKSDNTKNLLYLDGHVDLKNMGFDVKVYSNSEQVVLLIPVFSKYMIIPQEVLRGFEGNNLPDVDPLLGEEIEALWNHTVNMNNITKVGVKTVDTYEGAVKATTFKVSLQEQEVKTLMTNVFHLISTNEAFRNGIIESLKSMNIEKPAPDTDFAASYDDFILHAQTAMDTIRIKDFMYSGAYDKDLYIIEENMSHIMEIPTDKDNMIQVHYQCSVKRWDVNKPIVFDLPILDGSNSFTIKELEQNLPKLFESYFKELKAGKE